MNYKIYPPDGIPEAEVAMPLSKSVANRTLIIDALAGSKGGNATLPDCTDIKVMVNALTSDNDTIDCCDSGTALRFLTAFFAVSDGRRVRLSGSDRLQQRPVGVLVDALRKLGADIAYEEKEGFAPLRIAGRNLAGGTTIEIDSTISSQFVSALALIAPTMAGGLTIKMLGEPVSLPYTDLTLSMMSMAGIDCERYNDQITIAPGRYRAGSCKAEGDWSAASYWFEIEALTGGFMTLHGLSMESKQPDRRTVDLFAELGAVVSDDPDDEVDDGIALVGSPDLAGRFEADLSSTPDLFPALAATCAMIGVPFRLTGLDNLPIKESDRLTAIATELEKVGVKTDLTVKGMMQWDGRRHPLFEVPSFETYGDHRIAMALAPVAAYIPGIEIRNAEVVGKSYPEFWESLRQAGFTVEPSEMSEETTSTDQNISDK